MVSRCLSFWPLVLLYAVCLSLSPISQANPCATYLPSTKTDYGPITVLNLHGSYIGMGRAYGCFVGERLQGFYHDLHRVLMKTQKKNKTKLMAVAQALFDQYPEKYKQILRGMAETSGLSLQEHIFLNAFEHILYVGEESNQPACSSLVFSQSKVLFGRNYDYFKGHPEFRKMLGIAIFHPSSGEIPTALITFLGTLNATTVFNRTGLFLTLNNAYPSMKAIMKAIMKTSSTGPGEFKDRYHSTIHLWTLMFDASNLEALDRALNSYQGSHAFIINVADKQQAYSYEWTPEKIVRRDQKLPGPWVSTNHFLDKSWQIKNPNNLWFTEDRYRHLKTLSEKYRQANPSVDVLQKILNLPLKKGGSLLETTVFQVIADPSEQTVWVNLCLPENPKPWVKIPLKPLLNTD